MPRRPRLAGGPIARAHTHTHNKRRAGRGGRPARYLFCQPWRRLVYLLSTPSSAGSLRRPLPPHGLAATEPGLLRLPPPPSPAAADRPETPRPAREQEGEEPAEVARLLLRLLLLLPPPPSAPWAALSMVRARLGRGCPQRWRPRRWSSWRGGGYSSGHPGRAWLLQIPGKRLTHTGGRGGGGKEELGRKPTGLDAAAAAPPPAAARAPAPPSALVSPASSERVAGSASPPPVPPPLLSSPRGRSGPGLGALPAPMRRVGTPGIHTLPPPLGWEGAKGNLRASLPNPHPPRDLEGGAVPPTGSTRIWTRPA